MLKRLRKPADHEITDFTRFFTILAFLSRVREVLGEDAPEPGAARTENAPPTL
ncbi:hypothetical protein ACFWA5_35620 [Streptomyces mirabilis]|uniref:hypothetical protein n=1 Tax=Streptomyces mirabilis TaxID=68239 RepID=UPI003651BA60